MEVVRFALALCLVSCVIPEELRDAPELPRAGGEIEPCAAPRVDRVARVVDGDTVELLDGGERIRLLGIDTPEIRQGNTPADCWGDEAHAVTDHAIAGKEITLTFDADCEDIYGRTLAYLWLAEDEVGHLPQDQALRSATYRLTPGPGGQALLLNQWLAAQGHARVYGAEIFGRLAYQEPLERAESDARAAGRGLWGSCGGG